MLTKYRYFQVAILTAFILVGVTPAFGGANEVELFTTQLMPKLIKFAKREKVRLLEGETTEDFMAAAYNLARYRGKYPFGVWNEQIEEELKFVTAFLCALPWWPKSYDIRSNLQMVRRQITLNAYNRTIAQLSIKSAFFKYSREDVREFVEGVRKPPRIDSLMDISVAVHSFIRTNRMR